jgi:pyruvate/2-oxoglutarate dehydrogenase complex dihydrolipoamide dehydrogenase (E3) component
VLGGGAVGVEMAQAFKRLGCEQVTVVEALDRLLANEEPFAGEEVRAAFEAEGITVSIGARLTTARREGPGGPVVATIEDGQQFTADELLVAVGLTEAQARKQGLHVRAVTYGTGEVAGASTLGNGIRGTSKLVVDESRRVVVGATFTGPGVQELLHSATVAIVGGVTLDRLWHAVPSFPTVSEVWLRLLEAYGL